MLLQERLLTRKIGPQDLSSLVNLTQMDKYDWRSKNIGYSDQITDLHNHGNMTYLLVYFEVYRTNGVVGIQLTICNKNTYGCEIEIIGHSATITCVYA